MYKVLSIEAWRYDEGWTWNSWHYIDEIDIDIDNDAACFDALMKYVGTQDITKFTIEDDGYNIVLCYHEEEDRPLFAIEYGSILC